MFIRRIFYNPETSKILHSYMMQGDINPLTVSDEAARLGLVGWNVMEWTTPDAEIEQKFTDSYGRVSIVDGELVFDFSKEEDISSSLYETCSLSISSDGVIGVAEVVGVAVENDKVVNYQASELTLPVTINNLLCGSMIYITLTNGDLYEHTLSENLSVAHDINQGQVSYYLPSENGVNAQVYFFDN